MKNLKYLLLGLFPLGWPLSASAQGDDVAALAGDWALRIDAGGEIYSARFEFEPDAEGLSVIGEYEADGKTGRVLSVRRDEGFYVVEVATRRSGMSAKGLFIFEVIDDRLDGDVDFEVGTSVRSYEFQAKRVGGAPRAEGVLRPESPPKRATPTTVSASLPDAPNRQGEVTFRNGEQGYSGTVDTEIWGIAPSKPLDRQGTMTTDGNNGGGESQVLMRFDGVFGDRDDQAPRGSRIESASLEIVVFDPGSTVYVHRILAPWGASSTWDSLAAGLSIDNVEASTVRDGFSFGEINMDRQLVEFDVTQTVQKWSDGEPNRGWVFINTGGNGWDFYSSDWIELDLRPRLRIRYDRR